MTTEANTQDGLLREVFKVHIRGKIEDVWHEVTKTTEVQKPMFNMRMDCDYATVGAPWRARTANGKYTGIVGEILESEPPRRLSFTFKFTQHDDPPCRVTYELTEVDDGVEFVMISDRMPPNTKSTKAMSQGGKMIVDNLKAVIETGDVPWKTKLLFVLFKLTEPLSPKRLRSENWP